MMTNGYKRFEKELQEASEHYPKLKIITQGSEKFLRGTFDVIDQEETHWESYEVEIRYKAGFPYQFPELREIGGKIPKIADWHIYENTGSCCITVPAKETILCRNGISVMQFIENHLKPYFFNQTHRRHFGVYANGEYEHGVIGKWQNYFELFGTNNKKAVIKWLKTFLDSNMKIHKKSKCICGSGSRFRHCHQDVYWLLRNSSKAFICQELKELELSVSLPIPNVKTPI
jgi:hypothetical protein